MKVNLKEIMLTIKIKTIFRFLPLFLYHAVFAVIVFTNFPWGKFFIGWDALNPEFNLSLNFQRSFFASWQENYGLGTLGGHGFAAQLPHTMIISILSSLFPLWAVRSVFTFLCLYLGGLGLYFLAKLIFYKITVEEYQKKFSTAIEYICLLTALFYILNLATVQIFYLQLEAFIVHFASLPWLFWILFRLAGETNRKNLVLFFIINFFASIQGFIPSLFVAYIISLSLFAFVYILVNRFHWVAVKKSLLVLFLTFLVNAYWLLPFGYYQITKGGLTQNAYNSLISTEDIILKNKKYGSLQNIALMKGFSFDMQELGGYVFQPWIEQYNQNGIRIIGYGLFVFVLVSAVLSLILIHHVLVKISAVIFLYFLTSLATDSPVFSQFTQIMQLISPSYYQAFRTAFTKFALGYSFLFSLFLGLGLYILLGYSYRLLKHKLVSQSVFLGLFSLLIYFTYPVFKGNLLYKKLQVNIPQAYFEVMDFFKNKEDGRIADFPQDCPEGWYGYGWGYFGSGFYWYALKQPVLARTFDVWSNYNENYYWEIVQAVRSHDYARVDRVMQKYGVKWLLYDPNLIPCRSNRGLLQYDDFINHLESSPKYRLVKSFTSSGILPIKIFEITNLDLKDFVFLASDLPVVNSYKWGNYDKGYEEYGNYITYNRQPLDLAQGEQITENKANNSNNLKPITYNLQPKVYYPFRSLFTGRRQEELEFGVEDLGTYFSFKAKIPKDLEGAKLVIPKLVNEIFDVGEINLDNIVSKDPQVYLDGELIQVPPPSGESLPPSPRLRRTGRATPEVSLSQFANSEVTLEYIKSGDLEVRVPKVNGLYSYDSNLTYDVFENVPKSCDQFNKGLFTQDTEVENNTKLLKLTSIGSSNCLDIDLERLAQRFSYLVTVESKNLEGKSLLFSVINKNSQRADLETYLPKHSPGRSNFGTRRLVHPFVTPSRWPASPRGEPNGFLEGGINISYFVIPPMEPDAIGYSLHFDNISIGRVRTVNDLGRITVNSIPYRFLVGLKIISSDQALQGQPLQIPLGGSDIEVSHPNPSFYKVDLSSDSTLTSKTYMVLSQSFDKGWHAYEISNFQFPISNILNNIFPFFFGKEIKNHVLINNWENGWNIGDLSLANSRLTDSNLTTKDQRPKTIYIVYLPQYLEYLGFGLLFIFLGYLFLTREKKNPQGIKIEPIVN